MREAEYMRKLMDYIRRNMKKGYTIESLRWALVNQGYSRTSVERAIEEFNREMAKQAPELKDKPVIRYQIIDENNQPINFHRPWWKRFFGL